MLAAVLACREYMIDLAAAANVSGLAPRCEGKGTQLTRNVEFVQVGLHLTEHVDKLKVGRLSLFVQTLVHLSCAVGDSVPILENSFGSRWRSDGRSEVGLILVKSALTLQND